MQPIIWDDGEKELEYHIYNFEILALDHVHVHDLAKRGILFRAREGGKETAFS